MHISCVRIQNFRCFKDTSIDFQQGLNVIIGENNAGKTALLTAMRLILDRRTVTLTQHDFHYEALAAEIPPVITVTFTLSSDVNDTAEDRAVVASWLTRFGKEWEASLSCVYELPEEFHEAYKAARNSSPGSQLEKSQSAIEAMQEHGRFILRYFGGAIDNRLIAEPEWLSHFQGHHLDAIRDAEEDLRSGRATLLRRMLRRVLDAKTVDSAATQMNRHEFRARAADVMTNVRERLNADHLFELAVRTWSNVTGRPTLSGRITEGDLLEAIVLLLDHTSHQHPVSHGGLGYNNLLYVALVLASMRPIDGQSRGLTDTTFHALLVEEPEAHLHPALQYRFLAFLKQQIAKDVDKKQPGSRQLFLTSHSTHVTAAVGLDALRCLYLDEQRQPRIAYPGRAFGENTISKAYVERFLDATKSAMLFSKAVLFVEGISELLLVPRLADFVLNGDEDPGLLDRNYVAVVRVDGLTFHHFLPLFGLSDGDHAANGLLDRRIAVLSDGDPRIWRMAAGPVLADEIIEEAENIDTDSVEHDAAETVTRETNRCRKCWPFEPGATQSDMAKALLGRMARHPKRLNVGISKKTFEYDLAYANPNVDLLVTEGTPERMRAHLKALMNAKEDGREDGTEQHWSRWRPADASTLAKASGTLNPAERRCATVATFFLKAVEASKGAYASSLAAVVADELAKPYAKRKMIALPEYVIEPLKFICTLEPPIAWKQ